MLLLLLKWKKKKIKGTKKNNHILWIFWEPVGIQEHLLWKVLRGACAVWASESICVLIQSHVQTEPFAGVQLFSLGLVSRQRGLRGKIPQANGEWMQEAIRQLLCRECSAKKRWPARAAIHSANADWHLLCAGHRVGSGACPLSPLCPSKERHAVFFSTRRFRNKYIHKKGNKGRSLNWSPNLRPYGYLLCLLRSIKFKSSFGTVFMKHDYYDWQNVYSTFL